MQRAPHPSLLAIARVRRRRSPADPSNTAQATVQISFDFPQEVTSERHGRRITEEASDTLTEALDRACISGHSMAKEADVLLRAERSSRFRRERLMQGLQRAIRQRRIACEQIDGTTWLLPPLVRDAELKIARRARQLAEGPALVHSERARLEKISFICTSAPLTTVDVMRGILSRLNRMDFWPTLLARGADEAQWYRWKLGRPVLESTKWLRESASAIQPQSRGPHHPMFVLLDTSRLELEVLAEILEAIPAESALMLIGTPHEAPRFGHGQPFRDLVSSGLFQSVHIRATTGSMTSEGSPAPMRRSALLWRLRRGAGLRSNLNWSQVATIEAGEYVRRNRSRSSS